MIAGLDAGHAAADLLHDAAAFVPQNHGEHALGVGTREGKGIGVAHARRYDAHQDLACFRPVQIDFFDPQGFIGFPGNSRSRLH